MAGQMSRTHVVRATALGTLVGALGFGVGMVAQTAGDVPRATAPAPPAVTITETVTSPPRTKTVIRTVSAPTKTVVHTLTRTVTSATAFAAGISPPDLSIVLGLSRMVSAAVQ